MPPRSNRKKNKGKKAEAAPLKNNDTSKSMSMNSTVAFYKCAGCDNLGANFKVCSKCKKGKYCSAACQKKHWPQHKSVCGAYSLNFLGLGKPKLRFKVGDKVVCSVGDWQPWVRGTIDILWFGDNGSSPYWIRRDDGGIGLKAPEDDDRVIQKYSPQFHMPPKHPDLFKLSPPEEECPICFLRFPMANQTVSLVCCGQMLCSGCIMAMGIHDLCPFCREAKKLSDEQTIERTKKRMELKDAGAFHILAGAYDVGGFGLSQDSRKAHELWMKGADLGCRSSHYNLSKSYEDLHESRGVEKDTSKAIYHLEMAAMAGDGRSRCELGIFEQKFGNWEYSKKHWMISASLGCESCMETRIKEAYISGGDITKDEYEKTLRSFEASIEETKSRQRDVSELAEKLQRDGVKGAYSLVKAFSDLFRPESTAHSIPSSQMKDGSSHTSPKKK